ncbi:cysteine-rich receptor-like protein kinase 10 [Tanacetum coccineum]
MMSWVRMGGIQSWLRRAPILTWINDLERQTLDGKVVLVDADGKLLKRVNDQVNADDDSEVDEVFNETTSFMASTSSTVHKGSKSGSCVVNKNLYDKCKETYNEDPYDGVDFDDYGLTDAHMKFKAQLVRLFRLIEMEMSTVESLKFDLSNIETATKNFFDDNKIGEGGFGPVYKGVLANGTEIAVKRLSKSSGQGSHEFVTEVTLMAKLQHRNLVRLLGFCLEDEERILI